MIENFDESTITGTRAISGSEATRLRNSIIAASESMRPSSIFTSMICAPAATWSRATASAAVKSPAVISLRNFAEPVTFVRSPMLTKGMSAVKRERLEAGEAHQRRDRRDLARPDVADRLGDRADVVRRRAAAAADDVDEAVAGETADLRRHRLGAFVVLAEGVGKAGVGIGADERVGRRRDLFEVLAHGARAERTVEADGEGLGVPDRMPEGGRRLAGERASGAVGDRAGDHDGKRRLRSAKVSSQAKMAALAFSVSKMVSIRMRSAPPSIRPRICSP